MNAISLPARRLQDVAQQALDWLQDARPDSARLAAEAESLALRLRRCRRDARRLAAAFDDHCSLGIYGHAPQVKTALLRQLGIARLPVGQPALTLRYRRTPQPATPCLTLLEESDLAGLLFFAAGALPPDRQRLAAGLSALSRQPASSPSPGIDEDRLLTLWETLSHYQPQIADDPFWPAALTLAPGLSIDQRTTLFAPLWGERPAFSALYRRLAHRLQDLGGRRFALATDSDALSAVIDGSAVEWLNDEDACYTVLQPLSGEQTPQRCPQAELALLAAELTLSTPSGDDIFNHPVDLLDIPGVDAECEQTLTSILLSAKRRWLLHRSGDCSQPDLLLVSSAAAERQAVLPAAKALARWQRVQQGCLPAPADKPDVIWLLTARSDAAQAHEAAVQRHIGQPGVHWGTLLAQDAQDTRRMLDYLTTAVDRHARQRRLADQRQALLDMLTKTVLGDWLPAADGDEHRQQQQIARRLLQTLQARTGAHGDLLQQLLPPQEALLHLYQQPAPLAGDRPFGIGIELDLLAPLAGGDSSPPASSFADAALRLWLAHLRRLADNRALQGQLDIDGRCLNLLADTLINAAWRLGIDRQLHDALATDSGNAQRQTSLALGVLGDFVAWLGFQQCPPPQRPASRIHQGQPIFVSPHASSGDPATSRLTRLATAPVNNAAFYVYDWLVGLQALAEDNAGQRAAASLPARQQQRLARIVAALDDDGLTGE